MAHQLVKKHPRDKRFEPTIQTYEDTFLSVYTEADILYNDNVADGCITVPSETYGYIALPVVDTVEEADIYVQGGVFGPSGEAGIDQNTTQPNTLTTDNMYSGSFNYQLSFLKKDHVIITDINKPNHLSDGIGSQGVIIIPEHIDEEIKVNLDFYIQQASTLLGFGESSDSSITYINL